LILGQKTKYPDSLLFFSLPLDKVVGKYFETGKTELYLNKHSNNKSKEEGIMI
jgi:hypothetical protein